MPGARGGGPEHSQQDSKAAFWGDPTGLSVMQGNNEAPLPPPKLLLYCSYVQLPWFSGVSHLCLSLSRHLVNARAAWMSGYFTASLLALGKPG